MKHKEQHRLKKLLFFMRPLHKSRKDWQGFREFLVSPLHGNSQREAEILDQIGSILENDESGANAEKILCEAILPDHDYALAATKSNLRRRLNPILEHYYAYEALLSFQKDEVAQWKYVVQKANRSRWDAYFIWLYTNKAQKALDALPRTELYHIHQMFFAEQLDYFLSRQNNEAAEIENRYQEELNALIDLHAIQLLKLACNKLNYHLLTKKATPPNTPILAELIRELERSWESQDALVKMYFHILQGLYGTDQDQHYFVLKPILFNEALKYGKEEARTLFQHATNLCMRRYNSYKSNGEAASTLTFQQEILRLYNYKLEQGIIFREYNGRAYIDHGDFKNIVLIFSKMEEFDWVQNFIDQYGNQVLKNMQGVVKNFNYGVLAFFKKEFRAAERLFNLVRQDLRDSNDQYYALSAKGYYLRVLFELQKFDDCEREAKNIAKSINRNKLLPASQKEKALQLCFHIRDLCRAVTETTNKQNSTLDQLSLKIESGAPSFSLEWLREKVKAARK